MRFALYLLIVSLALVNVQYGQCKAGYRMERSHAEQAANLPRDEPVYPWVKVVHLVYMTHLDVGFTNFSQIVLQQYFNTSFPHVYDTQDLLDTIGATAKFKWTSHSWLLHEFLNNGTADQLSQLIQAINANEVTWHAGPFNVQYELMDPSLTAYAVDLAHQLDAKFGQPRKTVVSLKDVPGMTRGVIPIFRRAGIKAVHVGVNDFCATAAIPSSSPQTRLCNTFIWYEPQSNEEVLAFWCHGYSWPPWGEIPELMSVVEGHDEALVFLMRVDNTGPQNVQGVAKGYNATRYTFPNAEIRVSSLDSYVEGLWKAKDSLNLQRVSTEVGDTWIYATGSDPTKIRHYREMLRQRVQALETGVISASDPRFMEFSRLLVRIPEHTWGIHNLVEDNFNYTNARFELERSGELFKLNEASWDEHRWIINRAILALGSHPLAKTMQQAIASTDPSVPNLNGFKLIMPSSLSNLTLSCGNIEYRMDPAHGALSYIYNSLTDTVWATENAQMGQFSYQTFNQSQFETFQNQYNSYCPPFCGVPDFVKPHLNETYSQSKHWLPTLIAAYISTDQCKIIAQLASPMNATELYGAPASLYTEFSFSPLKNSTIKGATRLHVNLQWFNKPATRLPEAAWLSFVPAMASKNWFMQKLESWVSPYEVAANASRALHGVTGWLEMRDTRTQRPLLRMYSYDGHLLSPGRRSLLIFDNKQPSCENGMHWNLVNNLFNTGYVQWYGKDDRFRYDIELLA